MSLRRQLPARSPLTAGALLSGAGAMLSGGAAARRRVVAWLESEYGAGDSLLTDSGTTALTLAMRAARDGGRDAVALPAWGCYDLVTAALGAGVPVRWYDLDPATLGPDWTSFEAALARDAAATVIVHYYGVPVDVARARELSRRYGALLIEDAAQGVGGSIEGRPLGAHGDLAVLSFGRGKGITGGGGGALLANTDEGRQVLSRVPPPGAAGGSVRPLVLSLAQWLLARPSTYVVPASLPFLRLGETVFRAPSPPREITRAALGILAATLALASGESKLRRRNAARLIARVSGIGRVPAGPGGEPGYLRLPLLLDGDRRGRVDQPRARRLGIMPGYPRVLTTLPGATMSAERFAGAEELVRTLITLPVHGGMEETDLAALESWIR